MLFDILHYIYDKIRPDISMTSGLTFKFISVITYEMTYDMTFDMTSDFTTDMKYDI